MRTGQLLAAALCGAFWCGSAQAQSVTTTTTSCSGSVGCLPLAKALQPFDSGLGTLTGITLTVDVTKQTEVEARPSGSTEGASGTVTLGYDGNTSVVVNGVTYSLEITSPEQDVAVNGATFLGINAAGSGTFNLDSSLFGSFVGAANTCGSFVGVCVSNPTGALGTADVVQASNGVIVDSLDYYNEANYKLTYTYLPAVPEPAAWLMMLLGFAAIGLSLSYQRAAPIALQGSGGRAYQLEKSAVT